jgi:hypothetical protein
MITKREIIAIFIFDVSQMVSVIFINIWIVGRPSTSAAALTATPAVTGVGPLPDVMDAVDGSPAGKNVSTSGAVLVITDLTMVGPLGSRRASQSSNPDSTFTTESGNLNDNFIFLLQRSFENFKIC